MTEPTGWYVDEDLLDVYEVVDSARRNVGDVHGVRCGCGVCPGVSTDDLDWIAMLQGLDWAVITHDGFKRPGEREAVERAGLGVFRLTWRRSLPRFERTKLALARWDEMLRLWDRTPRPFIYRVYRGRPPHREQ